MIAAGQPGHAAPPDLLFLLTVSPDLDANRRQVAVERLHAHAVVEDDAVAVDAERRRVEHLAAFAATIGELT